MFIKVLSAVSAAILSVAPDLKFPREYFTSSSEYFTAAHEYFTKL